MSHATGHQCSRTVGEEIVYCEVLESLECVDEVGSACESAYDVCDFEEHGYEVGGLVFPPLRCPSCRRERKLIRDSIKRCIICEKLFVLKAGSKKFWKTHGLAQPPDYIFEGSHGPECPRCRDLDDAEKEKRVKVQELRKRGMITQEKMQQLIQSKNPVLLRKILEEHLREIDVADKVVRYDDKGNVLSTAYRFPGRTEVRNAKNELILRIYHQGERATIVDASYKVVGYTFWKEPSKFFGTEVVLGHYITYKSDYRTETSRTYEYPDKHLLGQKIESGYNLTKHADGKETRTFAAPIFP